MNRDDKWRCFQFMRCSIVLFFFHFGHTTTTTAAAAAAATMVVAVPAVFAVWQKIKSGSLILKATYSHFSSACWAFFFSRFDALPLMLLCLLPLLFLHFSIHPNVRHNDLDLWRMHVYAGYQHSTASAFQNHSIIWTVSSSMLKSFINRVFFIRSFTFWWPRLRTLSTLTHRHDGMWMRI